MTVCPNCGHAEPDHDSQVGETRDLARVATAAEAGYLLHVLQDFGLRAEVRPVESFDAVLGSWGTAYLVAVDQRDADDAVRVLQAETADGFTEAFAQRRGQTPGPAEPAVNPWGVLTVLAVVAAAGALFAYNSLGRERRRPRVAIEPPGRLLEALAASPTPFRSVGAAGGPNSRLQLNRQTGVWELAVDADRDGRYEQKRWFASPALGR